MGGRIEVASEHGRGSTFRFFIAARTCQTQKRSADWDMVVDRPVLKKRTTGKVGFIGPKPHVLIVEDNLINQTVLMRQLRHVGLTCEGESLGKKRSQADDTFSVASNGLEALGKIRRTSTLEVPPSGQPFDCVLMDLEMPGSCE